MATNSKTRPPAAPEVKPAPPQPAPVAPKKLDEPSKEAVKAQSDGEFRKVVEESKIEITGAEMKPVKRTRGPYNKKPREQVPGAAASPSLAAPNGAAVPGQQAAPDISKHLMGPLILISSIPAKNLGIPELALDRNEAMACAQSLNEILVAWAPQGQMNPKTASILSAAVVFGSIAFSKIQIYNSKTQAPLKKAAAVEKVEIENPPDPAKPFPTIDAGEYFAKKPATEVTQ